MAVIQAHTTAKEYSPTPTLREWGIGTILTLLLGALFVAAEPTITTGVASSLLLCGWAIWAWRYPRWAFACLLLVWLTVYNRATLPLFQVEGGADRGGLSLGDILWFLFALVWLSQRNALNNALGFIRNKRSNPLLLSVLAYVVISFFLPIWGVVTVGWSPSYAIPGMRHLQWSSFALFSIWLVHQYGVQSAWRLLLTALTIASVLHALYALIQYLATPGTISVEWLFLDKIFADRFTTTYFFYPRTTGLLTNPNNLGLFGAAVLLILIASLLARSPLGTGSAVLMMLSGLWVIITSASRSALVGVVLGWGVLSIVSVLQAMLRYNKNIFHHRISIVTGLFVVLGIATILFWLLTPETTRKRAEMLIRVAIEGASEDPNAIGRLDAWAQALQNYDERFPLGTWVPTAYALGTFVDNYYVCLIVQGTPLYLGLFICLLGAVVKQALRAGLANDPPVVGTALALLGMVALIGITSFTLMSLETAHIIALFWFLLGVGIAAPNRRGY